MALIPLNTFKTKTAVIGTSTGTAATVYTAPVGTTAIILMAQISNVTTSSTSVSFIHHRNRRVLADAQGNGAQAPNVDSFLVKEFEIPPNDAGSVLSGKLIIEELDSIRAIASNPNSLQLVLSILESANE